MKKVLQFWFVATMWINLICWSQPALASEIVLHDQILMGAEGFRGYNSTYLPALSTGYQICADDFSVPKGSIWTISKFVVKAEADYSGDTLDFTVKLMKNDWGKPGDILSIQNVDRVVYDEVSECFVLDLPDHVVVLPGTYWLCVHSNSVDSQFFWRGTRGEFGYPGHRYRPPEYPYWRTLSAPFYCLHFTVEGYETEVVPVSFAGSIVIFLLAGLVLFVKYRRKFIMS